MTSCIKNNNKRQNLIYKNTIGFNIDPKNDLKNKQEELISSKENKKRRTIASKIK